MERRWTRWSSEEDAILRSVYATEKLPLAAALERLPGRTYPAIAIRASHLGLGDRTRKRSPYVRTVRGDDIVPPARHPLGYVRPVMCPHCAAVFTVPADPRVR